MKTKVLLRIGSGNECNEFPSELNYLFDFPRPRLSCSPSVLGKTGLYVDNDVGFHSGEGEIQKKLTPACSIEILFGIFQSSFHVF